MCELCKQKPKILLESTASTSVSYLCRILCTFSTWNLYRTLSLGVPLTTTKMLWLCLEHWKYIFSISNCQSFAVSWKRNYEINWQGNPFYWQQNLTGSQTVLTVISSLWTWPFDCSLNLFVFTVSRVWHYNRNNLAVYFLKILCYSFWNCWKTIYKIDESIAHQLYFLNIPLILLELSKTVFRSHLLLKCLQQ